ncbi:MAG TPA: NAD(+) synthase [Flavobacteriaceae bacterium]|nr:NAD(+) synthase [Flavobacteriaceae bacterium]
MKTEKVVTHIVDWLKEYLTNSNMNGFVIGVSGGVDSAVTSVLCAKTGFPVLCVEMPIHQAKNQVDRAGEHILHLKKEFANVTDIQVDLSTTFESLKSVLPQTDLETEELSLANTRARLRMTTLYYFAGLHRFLVVGTGNKIEDFGVGFFTKYGDGGVDISPIADLLKSEVYELGKTLEISQNILTAPPTDGLFGDDRSDEMQLGATYDELEWAMEMAENNRSESDFSGRKLEVFKIYKRLHNANLHKMNPIPVCEIPKKFRVRSYEL